MASQSERRAALERITSANTSEGSSDSKAAGAPAGNPADAGANPAPSTNGDSMKILFQSVDLHKALPRLDAGRGQATQDTTRFNVLHGVSIEFDTATQLVRIAKATACHYVPIHGVERFGPTLADAELDAKAKAEVAEAKRLANEVAAAEAEAIAALPA